MTMRQLVALLLVLLGAHPSSAFAANVIVFKGRSIDLDRHLRGYPYSSPFVDLRSGKLFYKKRGDTEQLLMASFDTLGKLQVDLAQGNVISPRDFSKRTWWGAIYSPVTQRVIIQADERNDEIVNLYSLDPATGIEEQLTHTSYIYGWRLSPDARKVAYVSRATKDEMSQSELRVLDLTSGKEQSIYKDDKRRKIVWTSVVWQPAGRGVLLSYTASGDRARRNLLYVPLDPGSKPRVLSDESKKRYELEPLDEWLSEREFLYLSDESGVTSVYRGSLDAGKAGSSRTPAASQLVTAAGINIKSAAVLAEGSRRQLLAISGDPLKSEIVLSDARTGTTLEQRAVDGQWSVEDAFGNRAALKGTSLSIPFQSVELRASERSFEWIDRVAYPKALLDEIINCDVEKVSFATFDGLSAPGEKGTLHAYLLKPKRPRPRSELRGLVISFYGGANTFWTEPQILCQAGYAVLSPAPRGTADFGAAFYDLAAGDLGGAETLDAFAAGKYLEKRLGIPSSRIGITGFSRGGYDTLRALTFPGTVNGVREDFRFGFGISGAGIANILRASSGGNISQWYHNLTGGDPAQNTAKWLERSPEAHAHLISGPLLLVHGQSDQRVPVIESRSMYQKLKALGKEAYFLELEGQGHSLKGIDALTRYYSALFEFLDRLR